MGDFEFIELLRELDNALFEKGCYDYSPGNPPLLFWESNCRNYFCHID